MKPEEEAEIILWDWLKTKGKSVVEIYFNRRNKIASKIIDYLQNYVEGDTEYYINEERIKIKHFLIATDNSPKGYLFWDEKLIDNLAESESKSKHYAASIGIIPRYEGNR